VVLIVDLMYDNVAINMKKCMQIFSFKEIVRKKLLLVITVVGTEVERVIFIEVVGLRLVFK
jgi:hypothetical protein